MTKKHTPTQHRSAVDDMANELLAHLSGIQGFFPADNSSIRLERLEGTSKKHGRPLLRTVLRISSKIDEKYDRYAHHSTQYAIEKIEITRTHLILEREEDDC